MMDQVVSLLYIAALSQHKSRMRLTVHIEQ